MDWWLPHNFEKKRGFLLDRARFMKALRRFFDDQDFIEVETPALQLCPVMDAHIHGFKTDLLNVDLSHNAALYLHTSPEFDMKKLLTAGMSKIYQICHVFRNAEGSRLHSPEFTLIEWYRAAENYAALMDDCVDCLRYIAENMGIKQYSHQGKTSDPFATWERVSVQEAFQQYAQIDLDSVLDDRDAFAMAADSINVRVVEGDRWDDIFHAVMAAKIESNLGMGVPTILYDYPISMAALSRKKPEDERYAERFELYVCGIEVANAFSELTDAKEQRARYEEEMRIKKVLYGDTYPADESFFAALDHGMPESAGVALGVDRLVMLATGVDDIRDVLWAPVQVSDHSPDKDCV